MDDRPRLHAEASATSANSLLDKLLIEAPFPIRGIQVDGIAEFTSVFEAECQARGLELLVLPQSGPTSTAAWSPPNPLGVTPSPKGSTTTGRMTRLADERRPSISKLSAMATHIRLICADPGQRLAPVRMARYTASRPHLSMPLEGANRFL